MKHAIFELDFLQRDLFSYNAAYILLCAHVDQMFFITGWGEAENPGEIMADW